MRQLGLAFGRIYVKQHLYNEAIEACQEAIKVEPADDNAWQGLGDVYQKKGLHHEAVTALVQAVRLAPANADVFQRISTEEALADLAMSYAQLSETENMLDCLRQLEKLNPEKARELSDKLRR